METSPRICVVIPVYNHALTVGQVARECRRAFPVIVVNDGSTDQTPAMLARERTPRQIDALCGPEPEGKGGPLSPALSPSEGERGNTRQLSGESGFMGRADRAGVSKGCRLI